MKTILQAVFALVCIAPFSLCAQSPNKVKFGDVKADDFRNTSYSLDTSAGAVVIVDVGDSEIEPNYSGEGFHLKYKRYRRIHILKKSAYEAATNEISLYVSGEDKEKLIDLDAVTYNLENGKVVKTKMPGSASFTEKVDKNHLTQKFTLPQVKEGSIIEFRYEIHSDFMYNLQPWSFQGEYPRLWSEYTVKVPHFLNYVMLSQGYLGYTLTKEDEFRNPTYAEFYGVKKYWAIQNVPSLTIEPFTTTLRNHISSIEFQLASTSTPLQYKTFIGTWESLTKELMSDSRFGSNLDSEKGWIKEITQPLIQGKTSADDKARAIYKYVQENYKCDDYVDLYLNTNLRDVVKKKGGGVADINLLLMAMLNVAGLKTSPVILSRTSMGVTSPFYPLMNRFNYVVCELNLDNTIILLDASHAYLPYGMLLPECYNGPARVIDQLAQGISLNSDDIMQVSSVIINANLDKDGYHGNISKNMSNVGSYDARVDVGKNGKENYLKDLSKKSSSDYTYSKFELEGVDNTDENISLHYEFKNNGSEADIYYITPMITGGYKENPFKSANRFYPVELPYPLTETFIYNLEVPEGYEVEETGKPMKVLLDAEGKDGYFQYIVAKGTKSVIVQSALVIKKTKWNPEEYDFLRTFFKHVVDKQQSLIVLKKKS